MTTLVTKLQRRNSIPQPEASNSVHYRIARYVTLAFLFYLWFEYTTLDCKVRSFLLANVYALIETTFRALTNDEPVWPEDVPRYHELVQLASATTTTTTTPNANNQPVDRNVHYVVDIHTAALRDMERAMGNSRSNNNSSRLKDEENSNIDADGDGGPSQHMSISYEAELAQLLAKGKPHLLRRLTPSYVLTNGFTTWQQYIMSLLTMPILNDGFQSLVLWLFPWAWGPTLFVLYALLYPFNIWFIEIVGGYYLNHIWQRRAWYYQDKFALFHGNITLKYYQYWVILGFAHLIGIQFFYAPLSALIEYYILGIIS